MPANQETLNTITEIVAKTEQLMAIYSRADQAERYNELIKTAEEMQGQIEAITPSVLSITQAMLKEFNVRQFHKPMLSPQILIRFLGLDQVDDKELDVKLLHIIKAYDLNENDIHGIYAQLAEASSQENIKKQLEAPDPDVCFTYHERLLTLSAKYAKEERKANKAYCDYMEKRGKDYVNKNSELLERAIEQLEALSIRMKEKLATLKAKFKEYFDLYNGEVEGDRTIPKTIYDLSVKLSQATLTFSLDTLEEEETENHTAIRKVVGRHREQLEQIFTTFKTIHYQSLTVLPREVGTMLQHLDLFKRALYDAFDGSDPNSRVLFFEQSREHPEIKYNSIHNQTDMTKLVSRVFRLVIKQQCAETTIRPDEKTLLKAQQETFNTQLDALLKRLSSQSSAPLSTHGVFAKQRRAIPVPSVAPKPSPHGRDTTAGPAGGNI